MNKFLGFGGIEHEPQLADRSGTQRARLFNAELLAKAERVYRFFLNLLRLGSNGHFLELWSCPTGANDYQFVGEVRGGCDEDFPVIYPEILWCGSNRRAGVDGWSFPRQVEKTIRQECVGLSFVHLFGGRASFGTRLDIDPNTRPHVLGDAWIPPFARDSFDVAVLDPPYIGEFRMMSNDRLRSLFRAAAWIARKRVIWFHTCWVESPARCVRGKTWLVRVGQHCQVRCLQFFEVPPADRKLPPVMRFGSGPAMKYNRWLQQPEGLAFE